MVNSAQHARHLRHVSAVHQTGCAERRLVVVAIALRKLSQPRVCCARLRR